MKRYYIAALLLLLLVRASSTNGQIVSFLEFSPDARSLSLGGAGIATDVGSFAIFNNGASPIFSEQKMAASLLYTRWLPSTADNTLIGGAGFYKLGRNSSLNFGFRRVGFQPYEITDDNGNPGGYFTPLEASISLGAAYRVMPNLSASASFHIVSSDMGGAQIAKVFAVDLGCIYALKDYKVALKLSNMGSKIDYGNGGYSLPLSTQVGFEYLYRTGTNSITAVFNAGYVFSYSSIFGGVGGEYNYKNLLFARIGAHYGDKTKGIPMFVSTGLGYHFKGVTLDLAYLIAGADSPIRNSLSVGLGYKI